MRIYYYGELIADTEEDKDFEKTTNKILHDQFEYVVDEREKTENTKTSNKPKLIIRYYNA